MMMKQCKRIFALLLTLVMLLSVGASAWTKPTNAYKQLRDVDKASWAYNDIMWAVKAGVMANTGDARYFEPGISLTRSMFVKICMNLVNGIGRDTTYVKETAFGDVIKGEWYYDSVQWASENGIVKGTGDGNFGTANSITREQIATMMYNFIVVYCKVSLTDKTTDLAKTYSDSAAISDWARSAVSAMTAMGMLNGSGGKFNPQARATRAEAAAIAHRLLQYYNATPACFTGNALTKVWGDEFDGDALDTDVWEYNTCGDLGIFGLETPDEVLQYQKDHIKVEDGKLVMDLEYFDNSMLNPNSPDYVDNQNSSVLWVETKERFDAPYGYYEVRCKLNQGSGVNSAFWMSAGDPWYGGSEGSKDGTEIDVFETMKTGAYADKKTEMLQSTVHWMHGVPEKNGNVHNYMVNQDSYVNNSTAGDYIPVDFFDDEYHTFGVLWTEDEYVFYYDGYEAFRTDCSDSNGVTNVPAYILLSCHFMDPDWYGLSNADDYPTDFAVDYVRWYQLDRLLDK